MFFDHNNFITSLQKLAGGIKVPLGQPRSSLTYRMKFRGILCSLLPVCLSVTQKISTLTITFEP